MKSIDALINHFRTLAKDIPDDIRKIVNRPGGLTEDILLDLILNPQDQSLDAPSPPGDNIVRMSCDQEACSSVGEKKLATGKVAFCILAGGIGTRIGEPKALLRLPGIDLSLLTIKLFQAIGTGPIWIVVSPSLKNQIMEHVSAQTGVDKKRIEFIEQFESYRLHPNNDIVLINGKPDLYPCGHGDVFPALVHSGVLQKFLDDGGEIVSVSNVDNVLGGLDSVSIGWHCLSNSNVTCEVVERLNSDSGGFLCVDRRQIQIAESFRIKNINLKDFKWLNTNSIIFNANLNIKPLGSSWNRVQKNVNGRIVIQHERLLQEITEAYDSMFIAVNRNMKFFPIKNVEDLKIASERLNANNKR